MREIKFRAWHTAHKKMYSHENISVGLKNLKDCDLWKFMQFTGLQDKNGKDIYEGDIIEKEMSDRPYSSSKKFCKVRSVVVWMTGKNFSTESDHNRECLSKDPSCFNCEPGFSGKEIMNKKGYHCHNWSVFSGCEIIGNIHENPELLT